MASSFSGHAIGAPFPPGLSSAAYDTISTIDLLATKSLRHAPNISPAFLGDARPVTTHLLDHWINVYHDPPFSSGGSSINSFGEQITGEAR